jgi:hypothetical protein
MGLFRRNKNNDKPVVKQIIDLIPRPKLRAVIDQYKTDKGCHKYRTYDQLVALTFGQLNNSKSLRDISAGIGVCGTFIADLGLDQSPARSTMSDGNKKRDYHVFEALYGKLYTHYKKQLSQRGLASELKELENCRIKLVDSSTVTVCLAMFDWAKYRTAKGGIKLHTCIDDEILVPEVVNITEASLHDSKGFEHLIFAPKTVIVEDRAYYNFQLMKSRINADNTFVTRIKNNTLYTVVEELDLPEGQDEHILKDEIILLCSDKAKESGMDSCKLRLVHVYKEDENKVIEIITSNLDWAASTIAALYKRRWEIELFFKALKQNLKVKTFWGTSENAVRSQIFVALIVYMLTELVRRAIVKGEIAYSTLIERLRMCMAFYLSLDYVCNQINDGAKKAKVPEQKKMDFTPNLFSK